MRRTVAHYWNSYAGPRALSVLAVVAPSLGRLNALATSVPLVATRPPVTAGTIFHDRHLPLPLLFRAFWQVTSQKYGASALGVQRVLGPGSYETAWSWLHKLRRAMVRPGRERLSGRIEVDETYVGGMAEGKRGRGAERKALVVIAAQEVGPGVRGIRLARVPDAGAASLVGFVSDDSVAPGRYRPHRWLASLYPLGKGRLPA